MKTDSLILRNQLAIMCFLVFKGDDRSRAKLEIAIKATRCRLQDEPVEPRDE